MDAAAQADRDRETQHSYALQLAGTDQDLIAAAGVYYARLPGTRSGVTPQRKANQRCWLCEERRTCTKAERGWECGTCQQVR